MIHYAIWFGQKATVQFLLESRHRIGFNIEGRLNNGNTILHIACEKRDIEIVDLVSNALQKINSDIDFDTRRNDQATPLHLACINPKSDVAIKLLRRFPEKINVLGQDDRNILHYACEKGNLKLLKYIFGNSAFDFNAVDTDGWTPLHFASHFGQYEVVKFLYENYEAKGIDVAKKTNEGETAEDLAREEGHQGILNVLNLWTMTIEIKKMIN